MFHLALDDSLADELTQDALLRAHEGWSRSRARLREMMEQRCDLFHDERNVLSCLPAGPQQPAPAFIPLDDLAVR